MGISVALARIDEKDQPALFAWLSVLKEEFEVEVLVNDDLNSYSTTAKRLNLEHQVCRFHYLRWVNRLLNTLQKKLDDVWLSQRLHPLQFVDCLAISLTWDHSVSRVFVNSPTVYVPLCLASRC